MKKKEGGRACQALSLKEDKGPEADSGTRRAWEPWLSENSPSVTIQKQADGSSRVSLSPTALLWPWFKRAARGSRVCIALLHSSQPASAHRCKDSSALPQRRAWEWVPGCRPSACPADSACQCAVGLREVPDTRLLGSGLQCSQPSLAEVFLPQSLGTRTGSWRPLCLIVFSQ